MKATVWTTHYHEGGSFKPRKCIFNGCIYSVPSVGDYVVLLDGFAAERVASVLHDFAVNEVEITVSTRDQDNEYPEVGHE